MKGLVVFAVCLLPAAAFAEESYTNADLAKFQVPGAYNNQDLKRLPPAPMQKAPVGQLPPYVAPAVPSAEYQAYYDNLRSERDALAAEIEYEKGLVEFSESAFAGYTDTYDVRLGYRAPAAVWIRELTRRITLTDVRLESVADGARKAGVTLDRR